MASIYKMKKLVVVSLTTTDVSDSTVEIGLSHSTILR
mgnify:FL=1